MGNYNLKNIEFCKQTLLEKMTRPLPVIALYPKNTGDTQLLIQVIDNASVIAIRYISSTVVNSSIWFVGKSVEDVVQEINQLNIPIIAATIHNTLSLSQGDIVSVGEDHQKIPDAFTAYDRIDSSGIILRAKKIAVRHKNASKIRTLLPYYESPSLPWYPRISNGSFSQKYNNKLYHFYLSEFDNQSWSTKYGKPFKDLYGVKPSLKSENVYQLPRYPIYWDGQNIIVYNGDSPISEKVIEDIDVNNGLLYTKPGVFLQDSFRVDYSYLETSYVYKDININGHFNQNPLILNKYVVMYILPAENNQGVRKKTVFHSIGDSIDQAINSIQLDDTSTPLAILGAYSIQPIFSSDSISILDTRSKGGGLKLTTGPKSPVHSLESSVESDEIPIEKLYQEAYRYWDIGNYDGEAYPGAAAVAVDLPIDLQDVLSISDIRKKASKFMAAGVYPSIKFTPRDLPAITGLTAQTSCAYNLDFNEVYTGIGPSSTSESESVNNSIPAAYTGAGWMYESYSHPTSILSGDWVAFAPTFNITSTTPKALEVDTTTGVAMSYLKSTSWAGITWEEREVTYNGSSNEEPIKYTPWKKIKYYDKKQANTGELIKSHLFFDPENVIKQYKNIQIHSPILTGDITNLLKESISSIINNTLTLQSSSDSTFYGTDIINTYTDVTDKNSFSQSSDYILASNLYNHIFKLEDTPLEDDYYEDLYKIGEDFISSGTYTSGHYFKPYLQNINQYITLGDGQDSATFEYNSQLKMLNSYLHLRNRKNTWSGSCAQGAAASVGLVKDLMASTLASGPFVGGVPIYWAYYPSNVSIGFTQDLLSGFLFEDAFSLGGSISDVSPTSNLDYLYNFSLPAIMSAVLANTGETISDTELQEAFTGAYGLTVEQTISNLEQAINEERTFSGLPTTSHWFIGHNRLGTYLGNTVFNLIEAYESVNKYNKSRENITSITSPPGASPSYMDYMFSGIETALDVGYDAVYHNLLRGGIVEPDIALTLYGYGWYLNNWKVNQGVKSKTYTTDKRQKFESLFQNGLKQLVKNQITVDGELLETTTVYGEVGPFPASTASKILYPLGEALKYDYSNWVGVAEGLVNTLVNNYSVDGLYYQDPYRQSTAAGKENDVLAGLISMYKAVAQTGSYALWEPVNTGLSNLRGTEFLPTFDAYKELAPTGDWMDTITPLAFWKYYSSGDVSNAISILKTAGINSIEVPLDYLYWRVEPSSFHEKFNHLLSVCSSNRIRTIPVLLEGGSIPVASGQETDYVNSFGHTGGRYYYEPISDTSFMGSTFSGETYVTELIDTYDSHPSILAWSISRVPVNRAQAVVNYNTMAYLIKERTTTPIIYNINTNLSKGEYYGITATNSEEVTPGTNIYLDAEIVENSDTYNAVSPIYNPNIDFIGVQPNGLFSYSLDYITGLFTKPKIVSRYGDGVYNDYTLNIKRAYDRNLPFTLSNLFVKSGTYEGTLYLDSTSRNINQVLELTKVAEAQEATVTGSITQETIFNDKYFYPTSFTPGTNAVSILNSLKSWSTRESFSALTSGELLAQTNILSQVQASFDALNYVHHWPENQYFVEKVLTTEECNTLYYYSSTWSGVNVFNDGASHWMLSGAIDYDTYNTFLNNWGNYLYSICARLNING